MLPPGRARLATKPLPTGSFERAKTMGMVEVTRFAAMIPAPAVNMTSTLSRVNSAAICVKRSSRLPAIFDVDGATLDPPEFPEPILEGG
jgi:hypothetical protein